jgi:diguanylate cyclase (GGDEF)-like protein
MMDTASRYFLPTDMPLPTETEANSYGRRHQLLQALLTNNELLLKNRLEVHHLMTPDPVVIAPTMKLDEIASLLEKQQLHYVLVGGIGGDILGVVSDQDIRAGRGLNAQQLMQSPALVVAPNTPLNPAITYLLNESSSCLVVFDRGRLCGILTTMDLMLALQCMLQLWMRLAQVLDQDAAWAKGFGEIVAGLDGELPASQAADRIAKARLAIQRHVNELMDVVDLRIDVPTDVSNRRGLEEAIGMLLAIKRRFGHPFSLVAVAIDHFHDIEASCGNAVASRLVGAVARLIQRAVRDCDFMARCRADAFAVAMPMAGMEEAESFSDKLRAAAQQNRELKMELRIRVGAVTPLEGENVPELLERAESTVA